MTKLVLRKILLFCSELYNHSLLHFRAQDMYVTRYKESMATGKEMAITSIKWNPATVPSLFSCLDFSIGDRIKHINADCHRGNKLSNRTT